MRTSNIPTYTAGESSIRYTSRPDPYLANHTRIVVPYVGIYDRNVMRFDLGGHWVCWTYNAPS
jgi:hypothetical protein